MEEQPGRSYPASRTKVCRKSAFWGAPFPSHLPQPSNPHHICTRAHRHRHFVRGPLLKQQGGVQTLLRCHGLCVWYVYIGGAGLGVSSHHVVRRERVLKNWSVKGFCSHVEVSKLLIFSFPSRNACFTLKFNSKFWFYREKHRINEEIKLLRQRQERIDKELDRFVPYSTF